ncbi:MAG: kinase-like domain-containing protein [Piptocephalis tieghemiana]|nr:MAG: kinase-like domain-containing protein [Piptocephalis tieghemiana]
MTNSVKETLGAHFIESDDGNTRLNQYVMDDVLGRGAYGVVSKATDTTTGQDYAIKEFSKSRLRKKSQADMLRSQSGPYGLGRGRGRGRGGIRGPPPPSLPSPPRTLTGSSGPEEGESPLYLIRGELAIYKKLDHPNVVRLWEVLDDPDQDSLFMVFDLCENGSIIDIRLSGRTEPLPEELCRKYFSQLILGIEYLHESGVIHRDIKPENLLLSRDNTLKIVDFGVSSMFTSGNDQIKSSAGSPAFMSPELINGDRPYISGRACDIWSMGVVLYCMCFGCLPFTGDTILDVYTAIREATPEIPEGTDPDLHHLLLQLLSKDPDMRIKMPSLRDHPWVCRTADEHLMTRGENLKNAVVEVTEDEVRNAVCRIRSFVTVVKAVGRFKQLRKNRMSSGDVPEIPTPKSVLTTASISPSEEEEEEEERKETEEKEEGKKDSPSESQD